jgi:hypothetical protein
MHQGTSFQQINGISVQPPGEFLPEAISTLTIPALYEMPKNKIENYNKRFTLTAKRRMKKL